ncbi:MAG: hypothetical protein U0R52_13800 [Solirubrobacterales bacterium]
MTGRRRTLETDLRGALRRALPQTPRLLEAAAGSPVYLVGGAVRDLLLGLDPAEIDLVTEEDPRPLAARLGGSVVEHPRFGTASLELDGVPVDVARARSETYSDPGALPAVVPATLREDLGRRDFTVNAMAVPLGPDPALIDPHGGREDLERGLLRVLHGRSFTDDPTRALRAARYAARFGFELEPATAGLIAATDLSTVSGERRRAELLRICAEPSAPRALRLLESWGLVELREGGAELAGRVREVLSAAPWSEIAPLAETVLAAALGPPGREGELAASAPSRPSQGYELARGREGTELAIARAMGATWLDDYVSEWSRVELVIGGDDLIAAGVPRGPAVGRGLGGALRRKLDGEVSGREEELEAALAAARDTER